MSQTLRRTRLIKVQGCIESLTCRRARSASWASCCRFLTAEQVLMSRTRAGEQSRGSWASKAFSLSRSSSAWYGLQGAQHHNTTCSSNYTLVLIVTALDNAEKTMFRISYKHTGYNIMLLAAVNSLHTVYKEYMDNLLQFLPKMRNNASLNSVIKLKSIGWSKLAIFIFQKTTGCNLLN